MKKQVYYVYILASKKNGTLYVGVTSDLRRRTQEHKNDILKGFTKKYSIHTLVYYEQHQYVSDAIYREKQLKWWKRVWKIELIEKQNPNWTDLYDTLLGGSQHSLG